MFAHILAAMKLFYELHVPNPDTTKYEKQFVINYEA